MSCQQGPLYRAEESVDWGDELTLEQAQGFVDDMRDRYRRWHEDYPMLKRLEVHVVDGVGGSVGCFEPDKLAGLLQMASQHLRPVILCHEAAHVLAEARFKSRSHDPWFARIYLELVGSCIGPEKYMELYEAFKANDIDFDAELN